MCGIVGAVTQRPIIKILIDGLTRLEYRGYDSAGLAINHQDSVQIHKVAGKGRNLESATKNLDVSGNAGIAHTRWATHGPATQANAHPHTSDGRMALVHNGIIENHQALKQQLAKQSILCQSDTDTEVIAHLFSQHYCKLAPNWQAALRATIHELDGSYAIALIHQDHPNELFVAKKLFLFA